ncbi:hypothetical protein VTJ83DRAFT_951 [Remersonia thermophila]|uniref:Uncharacterized protein n=1 Tax=Remersonia thermophila TaxID=72144 RepID=A0ABR4DMM7_9PEZI
MKLSVVAALGLAALAHGATFKACYKANYEGQCDETTSGKLVTHTYPYKSYVWKSSRNKCVRICDSCKNLGYRCDDYSNNSIQFNKAIIFDWKGGKGPDLTTCC